MTGIFASPEEAEQAFYKALDEGNLDALMHVWCDEDEVVCVHPTGVRLSGLSAIRESWRSVLGSARLNVEVAPLAHWHSAVLAVHHQTETLFVVGDKTPHGPLHVTHVYSRGAYGWRLLSRHASAAGDTHLIDDAQRILH